jgi:hypothetical protein
MATSSLKTENVCKSSKRLCKWRKLQKEILMKGQLNQTRIPESHGSEGPKTRQDARETCMLEQSAHGGIYPFFLWRPMGWFIPWKNWRASEIPGTKEGLVRTKADNREKPACWLVDLVPCFLSGRSQFLVIYLCHLLPSRKLEISFLN